MAKAKAAAEQYVTAMPNVVIDGRHYQESGSPVDPETLEGSISSALRMGYIAKAGEAPPAQAAAEPPKE